MAYADPWSVAPGGTGLYIHTQSVDTTTPAGRAMLGTLGIFAEFDRGIRPAWTACEQRWTVTGASTRRGSLASCAGPSAAPGAVTDDTLMAARAELARGTGIIKTAKLVGLGTTSGRGGHAAGALVIAEHD